MTSCRAAAFLAAFLLPIITTSEAFACQCGDETIQETYAKADLIVKGRVKLVTYPVEFNDPESPDKIRMTRGEFEIEKVVKGDYTGKTVTVYTGAGTGDCGLLSEFLNSVVWPNSKFSEFELGLTKEKLGVHEIFYTSICHYAKGPEEEDEAHP